MKKIKDDVNVTREGNKYLVKRVIEEEYKLDELRKIVKDMETQLKRLEDQITTLTKQKAQLKEMVDFWKKYV